MSRRIKADSIAGQNGGGQPLRPLLLTVVVLLMLLPTSATEASNLCTSHACIDISAQILHNLNLSADPCQDFASFACGGMQQREAFSTSSTGMSTTMKEHSKMNNRVLELLTQPERARSVDDVELDQMFNATRDAFLACAGWFNPKLSWLPSNYRSGLNSSVPPQSPVALIEPVVREVNREKASPEEYLAHLVMTGFSGVLELLYEPSPYNDMIFGARQQGPVLTLRALNFHFASQWKASVAEEIEALCSELGIRPVQNASQVVELQNAIFNFNGRDIEGVTLDKLQLWSSNLQPRLTFNWTTFVENLQTGLATPDLQVVVVRLPDLARVLSLLVSDYTNNGSVVRDFLRIDAAMSLKNFLPATRFPALTRSYSRNKVLIDQFENHGGTDMIHYCVNRTITAMGPVSYKMYRAAYPAAYTSEHIDSLIANIKEAMITSIDEASWIRNESKRFMRAKIHRMGRLIAFHEFSTADLKQIYMPNNLMRRISTAQPYGEIVIASRTARNRLMLWALTSTSMPWHYIVPMALYDPFEVNAYYFSPINSIFLAIGYLDSYANNEDYPRYLQYGGIGEVIGHEIAHAFSPASCYLDFNGMESNATLDPETNRTYLNRLDCLVEFYDGLKVNGARTVGENLADIVGINAAFRAYKADLARSQRYEQQLLPGLSTALSPDQLFFVQAAQFNCEVTDAYMDSDHSPGPARIIGTVAQSADFARVFGCKPGDKMNLSDDKTRCPLW